MSRDEEMESLRHTQRFLAALGLHFYRNLFTYGLVASLSGVLFGIAEGGDTNPEVFYEKALGGMFPLALGVAAICTVILLFQHFQSRREDLDMRAHADAEAERPVSPPY